MAQQPQALIFNGLKFLPLGRPPVEAFHGFYANLNENGTHLYKPSGELGAHIVNNARQGQIIASASLHGGVPWYMFSTSSRTDKWLGIENMGMCGERDAIRAMRYEPVETASPQSAAECA